MRFGEGRILSHQPLVLRLELDGVDVGSDVALRMLGLVGLQQAELIQLEFHPADLADRLVSSAQVAPASKLVRQLLEKGFRFRRGCQDALVVDDITLRQRLLDVVNHGFVEVFGANVLHALEDHALRAIVECHWRDRGRPCVSDKHWIVERRADQTEANGRVVATGKSRRSNQVLTADSTAAASPSSTSRP